MKNINQPFLIAQAQSTAAGQTTATTVKPDTSAPGTQAKAAEQSPWGALIFPVIMIAVFYLLLIRPQQKREKQRKAQLKTIDKGDKVLTRGGIWGVIASVSHEEGIAKVKIADKVIIDMSIQAIDSVNPQNEPVKASKK